MIFDRLKQPGWLPDIIAILLLLLGITFFHWRGIQPGYIFLPVDAANQNVPWQQSRTDNLQNPLIADPLYIYFPFANITTSLWQTEGKLPLWNPYILSGHPALADPVHQPFYPLIPLLSLWLGAARAFSLALWGQLCLAALLTYGWLRISRFKCIPALAGAFTYALGGYLVTWFETTFWLSSLSLFPGILLLFQAALKTKKVVFVAAAAGLTALAFMGGQIQFTVAFILFLGAYALGQAGNCRRRGEKYWQLPAVYFAFIALAGVLLAGVFLLPFVEFVTLSHRYARNAQPLADKLPWQQLVALLLPDFYGNPTKGDYWGYYNYSEGVIYVSVVAFFLSSLTLFHKKRATTKLMWFVMALALYFILGGPGVSWLGFLPGFSLLSLHRTSFILPLFFAWLIAAALSLPVMERKYTLLLAGLCAAVVATAVFTSAEYREQLYPTLPTALFWLTLTITLVFLRSSWPRYQSWFNAGFVLLIFADLYVWGHTYNPVGKIADLMPPTPGIVYLQQRIDPARHRILVYQRNNQTLIGMGNSLSLYGLPVAGGNSSLVNDRYLQLAATDDPDIDVWWAVKGNTVAFSYPSARLLDLLGVTHQVAAEPLPYPDVQAELLQNDCSQTIPIQADERPLTGSFTPQRSAINRLDVKIRGGHGGNEGKLSVQLWQEGETPRLILADQASLPNDGGEQTLTFFFAPEREAPGKRYTWSLRLEAETAVSVICADAQGRAAVSVYGLIWNNSYAGEFYIYERLPELPRAYIVYAAETVPDDDQAVARLLDDAFDSDNQGITAVPVPLSRRSPLPYTPASIVSYQSDRVVINATASETGLLILRDQYHPGWKATIDGQQAPVLRVNHAFRGIVLPPGKHEIILTFQPTSLSAGMAVSGLGLFLLLVGLPILSRKSGKTA